MIHDFNALNDANHIAIQRLARNYLAPNERLMWPFEGACITAKPTWNRCGVPADAESYRYLVEHPDQGWSFAFRAVWRSGDLMKPAVHVAVEGIYDDDDHGEQAVLALINEWLRSL